MNWATKSEKAVASLALLVAAQRVHKIVYGKHSIEIRTSNLPAQKNRPFDRLINLTVLNGMELVA